MTIGPVPVVVNYNDWIAQGQPTQAAHDYWAALAQRITELKAASQTTTETTEEAPRTGLLNRAVAFYDEDDYTASVSISTTFATVPMSVSSGNEATERTTYIRVHLLANLSGNDALNVKLLVNGADYATRSSYATAGTNPPCFLFQHTASGSHTYSVQVSYVTTSGQIYGGGVTRIEIEEARF